MALRKFLFQSAEGFSEEQAAADDIALGGLTMSGAIAMGTNQITGMADGTAATDAVTLQQLDAISAGIDLKESCRLKTDGDYSLWVGGGPSGVGHTLTSPDNLVGHNDFDSVTSVVGDRIMVTGAGGDDVTADTENGIYEVQQLATGAAPTILIRVTDFDGTPAGEVSHGSFAFISEGTLYANQGWSVVTDDPITVDTTAIQFTQFQGLPSFVWGAGLLNTSETISVELDTAADAQGAGTAGGTSGLEFDAAGDGGQLRVAVHATQGLERTATGVALKLDGTTLQPAAAGASVLGVPANFEVNGSAVGNAVTAANLDTLTDGSDASALHTHAAGAEAARVENSLAVDEAVAIADAVYFTGTGDRVGVADAAVDAESRVIGVARTAQAVVGNPAEIVTAGEAAGVLSVATPGAAYYLAAGGGIAAALPGAGNRVIQVGVAASADDLFVRIVDYGKKAA